MKSEDHVKFTKIQNSNKRFKGHANLYACVYFLTFLNNRKRHSIVWIQTVKAKKISVMFRIKLVAEDTSSTNKELNVTLFHTQEKPLEKVK